MSRLKLFCGDETALDAYAASHPSRAAAGRNAVCQAEAPAIFDYQSYSDRWRKYRNDPLDRARTLRSNDRCPHCSRGLVKPLELADAVRSRNNLPIPGTATLVGFHCESCHWEWPA
jgi:hypothetical protein